MCRTRRGIESLAYLSLLEFSIPHVLQTKGELGSINRTANSHNVYIYTYTIIHRNFTLHMYMYNTIEPFGPWTFFFTNREVHVYIAR